MRSVAVVLLLIGLLAASEPAWAIIPDPDPDPLPVETRPTTPAPATPVLGTVVGSVGEALDLPDATLVTVSGKIVTATKADMGGDFFYIEEENRAAGVRVNSTASSVTVSRGDRVNTTGLLSRVNGERCIVVDPNDPSHSVQVVSSGGTIPEPLGMDNPTVGGTGLNAHTPGVVGATGPYNRGLLIRTWGYVGGITGPNWFYINDRSFLYDGTEDGNGIRVTTTGSLPQVGDYVVVTGISSSFEYPAGSVRRLLRARDSADVVVVPTGIQTNTVTAPPSVICGAGYHLIGLPSVPVDAEPSNVFTQTIQSLPGDSLLNNLCRWDTTYPQGFDDSYVWYADGETFGPVYPGEGYWLRSDEAGAISYYGIGEPGRVTDLYIKLAPEGWTLIGYPYGDRDQDAHLGRLLANVYATDGHRMLTLRQASHDAHWISSLGYWWDSATQGLNDIGLVEDWSSHNTLMPWHGYWIYSNTVHDELQRVALVIPSPRGDSISMAASDEFITPTGTSTVTARLISGSGISLEGTPVAFSTTDGQLSAPTPADGRTDQNGQAAVTLSDLPWGTTAFVTASVTDVSGQAIAQQIPITSSDDTPPTTPIVTDDGVSTIISTQLHATWSSSVDPESGVVEYLYAISSTQDAEGILEDNGGWESVGVSMEATRTGLSLVNGVTYYVLVSARNGDGDWSPIGCSDGIVCETNRVIYVRPDGMGDGTSWQQSLGSVGAAISAAAASSVQPKPEVWVAGDATHPYVGGIQIGVGIAVYGGFEGTETERDRRDWSTNTTILDGNGEGVVVNMTGWGITGRAILDGFTIRNGSGLDGGGVHCDGAFVLANLHITGNTAYSGGGIYAQGSGIITGCVIEDNNCVGSGGGITCYNSQPTMTNLLITRNKAASCGGGIFSSSASPTIANCQISNNMSPTGAGCYFGASQGALYRRGSLVNSTLLANSGITGGGIYCSGCLPKIANNTVVSNHATSDGGGVFLYYSPATVVNNIVAFNSSGICWSEGPQNPDLRNNDVFGNKAYDYVGLSAGVGDVSLTPSWPA